MGSKTEHGKVFERAIIRRHGLTDIPGHNDPWDAWHPDGHQVSVKTMGAGGELDLAGLKGNLDRTEDFYMVLGVWDENAAGVAERACSALENVRYILVPGELWQGMLHHRLAQEALALVDRVTMLPANEEDAAAHLELRTAVAKQWKRETPGPIELAFKVSHFGGGGSNFRVQCRIGKTGVWDDFVRKCTDASHLFPVLDTPFPSE